MGDSRFSSLVLGVALLVLAITVAAPAALLAGLATSLLFTFTSVSPRLGPLQQHPDAWREGALLAAGLVGLAILAAVVARVVRALPSNATAPSKWLRFPWWLAGAVFLLMALLPSVFRATSTGGGLALAVWVGLTLAFGFTAAAIAVGRLVHKKGRGSLVVALLFATTAFSCAFLEVEAVRRWHRADWSTPSAVALGIDDHGVLEGLGGPGFRGGPEEPLSLAAQNDGFETCLSDFFKDAALVAEADREARKAAGSVYGDTVVPDVLWKVCLSAPHRDFRSLFFKVLYRDARRERRPVDSCDFDRLPQCPMDVEPEELSHEEVEVYERAICRLDRPDRLLWEARAEGRSWREIGELLGIREDTARQRGKRAKDQLCQQIRALCPRLSRNVCR